VVLATQEEEEEKIIPGCAPCMPPVNLPMIVISDFYCTMHMHSTDLCCVKKLRCLCLCHTLVLFQNGYI